MTTAPATWCFSCGRPSPLSELLRVSPTDGGAEWYVCRPSLGGACFGRSVPPRTLASIAMAEGAPRSPEPLGPPDPTHVSINDATIADSVARTSR